MNLGLNPNQQLTGWRERYRFNRSESLRTDNCMYESNGEWG